MQNNLHKIYILSTLFINMFKVNTMFLLIKYDKVLSLFYNNLRDGETHLKDI